MSKIAISDDANHVDFSLSFINDILEVVEGAAKAEPNFIKTGGQHWTWIQPIIDFNRKRRSQIIIFMLMLFALLLIVGLLAYLFPQKKSFILLY